MSEEIVVVDLFAGAGGFSTGAAGGLEELGYDLGTEVDFHAINHDADAIETHRTNHSWANHYQNSIDELHPPDVVDGKDVNLLIAGPTCTHFSNARGGQPINEQLREPAWNILTWIQHLEPEYVVIENVGEIRKWGPTDEDGEPTKDGSIFEVWIQAFEAYGYTLVRDEDGDAGVVLTAADYGDPTSRDRLFIIGSRSNQPTPPAPTHARDPGPDSDLEPWRVAKEIVDLSDRGDSIWERTQPLCHNTMVRIADGIRRYGDERLQPFVDALENLGVQKDIEQHGKDVRLTTDLQDDVVPVDDLQEALEERTEPFLVSGPAIELTEEAAASVDGSDPSMLMGQQSHARALDVEDNAVPTVATRGAIGYIESTTFVLPRNGSQRGALSNPAYEIGERPLHTVTAQNTDGHLVSAYLLDYHGTSTVASLEDPLGAIRTRNRFALCTPEIYPWGLDIRYRLLEPEELKLAQGFPPEYEITGGTKKAKRKQIGNAVPVNLGKALVKHVLADQTPSLTTYGAGITAEPDAQHPEYEEILATDD